MSLKNIVKQNILPIIVNTGAERLLNIGSPNILNVFYHGVVKKDSLWFSPRHLIDSQFEEQLKYFKKNFEVISLSQAFDMYQNGIVPKRKTITISFDDGYINNLTTALPLLEKYQLPATFFICGFCVDETNPIAWSDMVAFLRSKPEHNILEINDYRFTASSKYDYIDINKQLSIWEYIKKMKATERDILLDKINTQYDIPNRIAQIDAEVWKMMNPSELQEMAKSPLVTLGSHANKHYNLGMIDYETAVSDMKMSKDLLENLLQKEIDMIAYPDGNYTKEVKDASFNLGMKKQLAVKYLLAEDKQDTRILNRFGISNTIPFSLNMIFLNMAFHKQGFC